MRPAHSLKLAEYTDAGGYFAFVTDRTMDIFHYNTEFGVEFVPVQAHEIMTYTLSALPPSHTAAA